MGASSVTGVGSGSADLQQGSKHTTLGVGRLVGPRIMMADIATLSSGAKTVVLPALPGVTADYTLLVSNTTTNAACGGSLVVTADTSTVLTLAGTGSNVLAWAIVKIGMSL